MRTALVLILLATTACSPQRRVDRMNRGADLDGNRTAGHEAPPPSQLRPAAHTERGEFIAAPTPAEYTPSGSALLD